MSSDPVESSALLEVGYDTERGILQLKFVSGRVYQYFLVPVEQHRGLMEADSKGAYFNRYIRSAYPYVPSVGMESGAGWRPGYPVGAEERRDSKSR